MAATDAGPVLGEAEGHGVVAVVRVGELPG